MNNKLHQNCDSTMLVKVLYIANSDSELIEWLLPDKIQAIES